MNFSVIIPAKNEERNIGRCLESLLAVTWDQADYEILLIDNGSSDRTLEIARALGVRCFLRPNDTIAGLRNFGARQARGRILAFLDADCTVDASWLREASRYIERVDVVGFGSPPIVPAESTWVQRAWFQVRRKKGIGQTDWLESMNLFVRREAFDQLRGFKDVLVTCEDYDLSLRLGQKGQLVADERIIAVHHGEASTASDFFRKEMWRGTSNLKGISIHGISKTELPSLMSPILYGILAVTASLFVAFGVIGLLNLKLAIGLILLWQMPLLWLATLKAPHHHRFPLSLQLYLLLNIYFAARAGAIFSVQE